MKPRVRITALVLASLVASSPAWAQDMGSLVGGLAGGMIGGMIAGSMARQSGGSYYRRGYVRRSAPRYAYAHPRAVRTQPYRAAPPVAQKAAAISASSDPFAKPSGAGTTAAGLR